MYLFFSLGGYFMNILVTGGSRGIGRALVERFCADGHNVAFIYNKSSDAAANLVRLSGATAICADIRNAQEVNDAVDTAIGSMGSIDVLINNAGISQFKLLSDVTNADWDNMLGVNLSGAFYVTRRVIPHMVNQQNGRIIMIGSMWGKVGASCETHYSATKAALRGMTMALAKELGPSNITVNCIEPGVIATEMHASLDEAALASLREETPLGRIGDPNEIASLAAFLASDEASFITGQCIGIDGGFAV
jgi:3-oxoacyl-[acyl-carrier protein] reductase